METKFEFPKLDEALLGGIIHRIVATVQPEKIVMFGSRARGEAKDRSDLDLLVIANTGKPRLERTGPLDHALRDIMLPTDILVYTQDEVDDWRNVQQHVVTTAMREGKIIYEKTH